MQATPTNILPDTAWPIKNNGGVIRIINEGTINISLTALRASMAPGNVRHFTEQKTGDVVSIPLGGDKSFNITTLEAATQFQFTTTKDDDIDILDRKNCVTGFPNFTILPRDDAWDDSEIIIKLKAVPS